MGNVVLINPFEVPGGTKDEFLRQGDRAAACLQSQPGLAGRVSTAPPGPGARFRVVTVAGWTSPHDFQAAVASDGLRKLAEATPLPAARPCPRSSGCCDRPPHPSTSPASEWSTP